MYRLENLAQRLKLKKCRFGYIGGCPACGYPTGFTLKESHGKLLAYCHVSNCSWTSLQPFLNGDNYMYSKSDYTYRAKVANPAKVKPQKALRGYSSSTSCYSKTGLGPDPLSLWSQSLNGNHPVIINYLRSRGITLPVPSSICYLPRAYHSRPSQYHPAMLAKVQFAGSHDTVAVHRTFLKADGSGKAEIDVNKKFSGSTSGASVHFAEPTDNLAVTEGIETGLSVQQLTGIPTWSALNCNGLKTLIVPESVKTIVIFADNDSQRYTSNPGLKAAHLAAERWCRQGFVVKVIAPHKSGMDFNDLLKEGAFSG